MTKKTLTLEEAMREMIDNDKKIRAVDWEKNLYMYALRDEENRLFFVNEKDQPAWEYLSWPEWEIYEESISEYTSDDMTVSQEIEIIDFHEIMKEMAEKALKETLEKMLETLK